VWRGRLAFGMVSIPVRLYKAARRERIRFHHVYRPAEIPEPPASPTEESEEPSPVAPSSKIAKLPLPAPTGSMPVPESVARVRNMPVGELTQSPVPSAAVLKGFEIEKDRYVTFEPKELAAIRPRTSTELTIGEFVRLQEIDPIFFETSYYAAPDRGGEKPYALLFTALAETNYAAVGTLAMHGREHATLIRPGRRGLILHTLFYENEVRADEEYQTDPALVAPKELDLAKMVIRALAAPFDPGKLKDKFEERLRQLIDSRTEMAVSADAHGDVAKPAWPLVDIMDALRKSLEMVRKPPKSEKAEPAAKALQNRHRGARR
jgi:DNA end-binding protein Ku